MTEKPRRYRIHYGQFPGEKGYVIVDSQADNELNAKRKVVFTSHNKGETYQKADQLNSKG